MSLKYYGSTIPKETEKGCKADRLLESEDTQTQYRDPWVETTTAQ